jgi:3-hydroxyisobutyrate dehydrogenase-like beta-hydroxyacid dehydrogenase
MKPGAIAIECSTITPAWAHELGGAISNAGIAMLEAPVSGSTPQAENAQLVFLIGGDGEMLKRAEPRSRAWVPAFDMQAR